MKLVILHHFLPFIPPKTSKNQNFEKWKNLLEMPSFYTRAPKITVTWCMVPETDRIFCHFGPFFALLPLPHNDPEYWKFEKKMKKMPGDIILLYLHVYLKWRSYDVWFLRYGACDRQNFLLFWTVFCPLTTQKIKLLKKWKAWRYYHFTHK